MAVATGFGQAIKRFRNVRRSHGKQDYDTYKDSHRPIILMVMSLLMFGAHKHPHNCLRKKSALKDLLLSKSTHKTSIIHRRVETKQVSSSEEYK